MGVTEGAPTGIGDDCGSVDVGVMKDSSNDWDLPGHVCQAVVLSEDEIVRVGEITLPVSTMWCKRSPINYMSCCNV